MLKWLEDVGCIGYNNNEIATEVCVAHLNQRTPGS